jgi:hypothetical protein
MHFYNTTGLLYTCMPPHDAQHTVVTEPSLTLHPPHSLETNRKIFHVGPPLIIFHLSRYFDYKTDML